MVNHDFNEPQQSWLQLALRTYLSSRPHGGCNGLPLRDVAVDEFSAGFLHIPCESEAKHHNRYHHEHATCNARDPDKRRRLAIAPDLYARGEPCWVGNHREAQRGRTKDGLGILVHES
eukprot:COSAG05_NODE_3231_length_2221_cov_6.577286_1_plen_118_part_00